MVNQAFRIKIAYRSKKEKKKEEKIPGIGRYPMGPTIKVIQVIQERVIQVMQVSLEHL